MARAATSISIPLAAPQIAELVVKIKRPRRKILFLPNRTGGYWSDQGYEWFGGT